MKRFITFSAGVPVPAVSSRSVFKFTKGPRVLCMCLLLPGIWLGSPDDASGQPTITSGPSGQVLSAGGTLTLTVSASGTAPLGYQWYKDNRQLVGATNSTLSVTNASLLNSGTYFVLVSNSTGIARSLTVPVAVGNPSLLAWGSNTNGQLGNGSTSNASTPVRVAGNVVAAAAGDAHSLFISADGTLWAMGRNGGGQLGNDTTTDTHTPVSVASNVMTVAAGAADSLIVTNGALCVMGSDFDHRLGMIAPCEAGPYEYLLPTVNWYASYDNNPPNKVLAAAAGGDHSLYLMSDGTLWGMGFDLYGQTTGIVDGSVCSGNYVSPPNDGGLNSGFVVAVAAGSAHSLYMQADGTLWSVGFNGNGQKGNGTTNNIPYDATPFCVASNVTTMAAGAYHSLFVKTDGTLWAMGYNAYGQLGNGTTNDVYTPVCVASNVVAVSAGAYHSLFTKTDGTLWAMGDNAAGQLGNGTTINSTTPVVVPWVSAASVFPEDQASHSLALGIRYTDSATLSGSLPTFTFVGTPGASYNVVRSTNLLNWTAIWTTNEPVNGVFQFTDPAPPQPDAYYKSQPAH